MTYVVTEDCIKCKFMDCIDVCPVDCFYEGENMLVIHPEECIDCGVCEPECPAEAIYPDTKDGMEEWLPLNKKYSEIITQMINSNKLSNNDMNVSGENIENYQPFQVPGIHHTWHRRGWYVAGSFEFHCRPRLACS